MRDFFDRLLTGRRVVSIVGGGGKTSLMFHLAARLARAGKRVAVITSTRISDVPGSVRDMAGCRSLWAEGTYAVCGEPAENGKLALPAPAALAAILREADVTLCEADGSRGLPCKAPAAHEPVILPETELVIGVMGLDALGKPVGDVCHRPQRVCALLGCEETHRLTAQDMAAILLHERGTRKGVGLCDYAVVLNKCDDETRRAGGLAVARHIGDGAPVALVRLREGTIVWTSED